jgi:hypothetical protein
MYIVDIDGRLSQVSIREYLERDKDFVGSFMVCQKQKETGGKGYFRKAPLSGRGGFTLTFIVKGVGYLCLLPPHEFGRDDFEILHIDNNNNISVQTLEWFDALLDNEDTEWTTSSVTKDSLFFPSYINPGDNLYANFKTYSIIFDTIDYYVINDNSRLAAAKEKGVKIDIYSPEFSLKDCNLLLPYTSDKIVVEIDSDVNQEFLKRRGVEFIHKGEHNLLDVFTRTYSKIYSATKPASITNFPRQGLFVVKGHEHS